MRFIAALQAIAIFCIILAAGTCAHAAGPTTYHVLVINSYHRGLSWTDLLQSGIESRLAESGKDIEVYVSYLDTKRIKPSDEYFRRVFDLYTYMFKNLHFDVVISSDDDALQFLFDFHDKLFPNTPVVACGVSSLYAQRVSQHPMFTGVIDDWNIGPNVELAVRLFPETRQIVFVHDGTTTGIDIARDAESLAPRFPELKFAFFSGRDLSIHQIQDRVRQVGKHAILFPLPFTTDKDGTYLGFGRATEMIISPSPVPAIGFRDYQLGHGIVGGLLIGGKSQGRTAAELALRIINGEDVGHMPVVTRSSAHYMFDHKQLKQLGIPVQALPPGSTITGKPRGFWADHLELALAGIAAIGFLLGIVLILATNIARRRRAEAAMLQNEQLKRQFYRETILSVTDGKLDVVDEGDVRPYIGSARLRLDVSSPSLITEARHAVRQFCVENDMDPDTADSFILGVGEAMTNAIKHAGGGYVYSGVGDDEVWVAVVDHGPGIESLILPRAVLLHGFSTKPSLGMGYSVMLDVSDRLLLATDKAGTTVILTKRLGEPPPSPKIERMLDSLEGSG